MRNYIKFWTQQVNLFRTSDSAYTTLQPVAGTQEELEDLIVYSVNYTNEGTAGYPYDVITREAAYPVWFEMNKKNVLALVASMFPYAMGVFQPYPSEEFRPILETMVFESPRDSWSHGH